MKRSIIALAMAMLLAACSSGIVPPAAGPRPIGSRPSPATSTANPPARQPTASTPLQPMPGSPTPAGVTTAAAAGLTAGPPIASLPVGTQSAAAALGAFRTSCPGLVRRNDASGLTRGADWQPACEAARAASDGKALAFFARYLEPVQIADGKAFATGYYEPEIHGSRTRGGVYQTPIYARPKDLIEVDLGLFSTDLKGKRIRGRVNGAAFVPYFDRTEIEEGALAGRGLEIGYAADPVEFFFLQIQGSGRLRLPDGGVMRIGYDSQNGREYTGIGALMRTRGLLGPGQASMQGLMGWIREHPVEGVALMRENKSFVFFRELTGPGPLGAMGYPVVGGASVAADPKFIPLGAPVFLSMDRADANGLWIAQDTGGAIKGANRVDTFWGAGDAARATAGGMSAKGTAFLLLPKGTLARLQAGGPAVAGRRLSPDEAALWKRVMAGVRPLPDRARFILTPEVTAPPPPAPPSPKPTTRPARAVRTSAPKAPASAATLDGSWDRRLSRGLVSPDRSVDLHGHGLHGAYILLDQALERAIGHGDRLILLVTGKPPPRDSDRPHARGAIRAAVGDWLAASRHSDRIAAVRGAHPRHGGAGALYIVLRRSRQVS